ncbi:hypothetical protein C0991_001504 [Blastosporella zonata]|nr:hypothetical protein C0991_001504 [Blastosporella zonata]
MTAPFGHFFEGPPSRGDEGTMEMVSLALKAKAKARAAWALFQVEGTKRAERQASRQLPKVTKRAGGHGTVNQNPSFQKSMANLAGLHPTTRFLVDEGLEGTIGVCLNWTTRAVVKLAPYAERLAYQATQGPCMNRGAVCKDRDRGSARKPAPTKGRFHPHVPPTLELKDGGGAPEGTWMRLAGQLQRAWVEVAKMGCLCLELADLEAVLDAGVADAKGEDKEEEEAQEDQEAERAKRYNEAEWEEEGEEAKMAKRGEEVGEAKEDKRVEAKRAERDGGDKEEEGVEAKRAKREEGEEDRDWEAERAERGEGSSGGFRVLSRRPGSGLGRIVQQKWEKMATKRATKGKMRRG